MPTVGEAQNSLTITDWVGDQEQTHFYVTWTYEGYAPDTPLTLKMFRVNDPDEVKYTVEGHQIHNLRYDFEQVLPLLGEYYYAVIYFGGEEIARTDTKEGWS